MRILSNPIRLLLVLSFALALPSPAAAQAGPVTRYLVQVDWEAHATERLVALAAEIRTAFGEEPAIAHTGLSSQERIAADLYVEIRISDPDDFDDARTRLEALREASASANAAFDISEQEDGIFRLAFARNGAEAELGALADEAANVIRGRLTDLGVKPLIAREGDGVIRIAIQAGDSDMLAEMITQRGLVSFRLVRETVDASTSPPPLEPGTFLFADALDEDLGYIVGEALLGGAHIEEAIAGTDEMTGAEVIGFRLDAAGAAMFAEITAANIGGQFAIAVDNFVLTAPIVREAITGGEVIITGAFNEAEARVIAALLNNGALPAPLLLLEEGTGAE